MHASKHANARTHKSEHACMPISIGSMGPRGPQGFQGFPGMPARPRGPPVIIKMPGKLQMQVQVVTPHNLWKPVPAGQPTASDAAVEAACGCACGSEARPCGTEPVVDGVTEVTETHSCRCDPTAPELAAGVGGIGGVTKADLAQAVDKIVSAEAKSLGLSGAGSTVSLGQDPSVAEWCADDAAWKGPYGDPCSAYRVGGDRNFWCEWDGANAPNACPYSCGSCTLKMKAQFLAKTSAVARRHGRAEVEQTALPAAAMRAKTAPVSTLARAATAQKASAQMLVQETAEASKSRAALAQEVAQLKQRLNAIAAATGYDVKHGGRGKKVGLTGSAAAADMHNFFSEMSAAHGSSEGATRVIATSRDASRQLGEYFNSLPTGEVKHTPGHEKEEALPEGALKMSAYDKAYVSDVERTYGTAAAQEVVNAERDGRKALLTRKVGQGALPPLSFLWDA